MDSRLIKVDVNLRMTKSSATSITGDCPGLDFCGWNLSNQVNGKLGIDLFRGALETHQTVIISFPVLVQPFKKENVFRSIQSINLRWTRIILLREKWNFRNLIVNSYKSTVRFTCPVCVTGSLVPWLLSFTEVVENAEKEFIVHFFCKFLPTILSARKW